MPSSEVTRQSSEPVQQPSKPGSTTEAKEYHASGSANAGLNLNLVGAVAGVFSGKSKKETATDGSSVEHREEQGRMKGAGKGHLKAAGDAQGEEHGRELRQAVNDSKA